MKLAIILITLIIEYSISKIVDHLSYSNPNHIQMTHLHLDLRVDFDNKQLVGWAILSLRMKKTMSRIALDCQGIDVDYIYQVDRNNNELQELDFRIDNGQSHHHNIHDNGLGERLLIYESFEAHQTIQIRIEYRTNQQQTAVGWTDVSKTNDKVLHLLYTQCESTYCRSLVPIQDTPSIKFTYTADIKVLKEYNVQMSANLYDTIEQNDYKIYKFNQDLPVTSYMLALVVGHFKYQQIGHRTGIFTEHSILEQTAQQLSSLENYLEKAEQYVDYEYPWKNYTIVVVPNSFPPAGMENPQMTFMSQDLITNDHEMNYVAIHEIMHSWFGNLVTCRNWTSLWLNEGITTFTERMISKSIRGDEYFGFKIYNSYQHLNKTIHQIGVNSTFTSISPQYSDNNNFSRSFFSQVPYEKGFFFLYSLQQQMGSYNMRKFLNYYLNEFKYSHTDTEQFVSLLKKYVSHHGINVDIDYDEWIYKPGLPKVDLNFDKQLLEIPQKIVDQIIEKQDVHENKYQFDMLSHGQKTVFINYLVSHKDSISKELLVKLEKTFEITKSKYNSIRLKMINLLIAKKSDDYHEQIQKILASGASGSLGIYKSLLKHGFYDQAINSYQQYREFYHPQIRKKIQRDIVDFEQKQQNQQRLNRSRNRNRKRK